jgi:CTP synthase (UTP-ammonia lyase)
MCAQLSRTRSADARRPTEKASIQIAIVGDYKAGFEPHVFTDTAIGHSALKTELQVHARWIPTTDLVEDAAGRLAEFDGIWISPGSPYRSIYGALAAITYARTFGIPLLGNCGGFQHVVIEFARNVLGWKDADSSEHDPDSGHLVVVPTACFLVGQTMRIDLKAGSRIRKIYGIDSVEERYYCRYGLNPAIQSQVVRRGLQVTGVDDQGEPRVVELQGHRFSLATLFVPQARSTPDQPHPVITAFLNAARQ